MRSDLLGSFACSTRAAIRFPLASSKRQNFAAAAALTFALKSTRNRGTMEAFAKSVLPRECAPFTRIGGVSAVSSNFALSELPAPSFNPGRSEILNFVPSGSGCAGAKVPLRVLSQTKRPSIGGSKTNGETSAGLPICSAATISAAKRTSNVLRSSSFREGSSSCTAGSSAQSRNGECEEEGERELAKHMD